MIGVFLMVGGVFGCIAYIYNIMAHADSNNDKINYYTLQGHTTFTDTLCMYLKLPYKETYSRHKGKTFKIYTTWYAVFFPMLIIMAAIKFVFDKSIGNKINTFKQKQYQNKLLINIADIYSFEQGDKLKMKSGETITLDVFSPSSFSDKGKNIYSWAKVVENITANERQKTLKNNVEYEIFFKEAQAFKKKADSFKQEMKKQQEELVDRYKND